MDSVVVTSPSSGRDRSRDRDRERDRDRDGGRDGGRERERERRPTASLMVCKDHVRGRCSRADCKFAHPLPTHTTQVGEDGKEMVVVCNDSLRGRCARGLVCRYFHPPPHLVTSLAAQVGITPPAALAAAAQLPPAALPPVAAGGFSDFPPYFAPFMPPPLPGGVGGLPGPRVFTRPALEVCRDYMKGRCTREASECRFAHTTPNSGDGNLVTVCQDFLKGRCSREACCYFHPDEHLRSRIQDVAVTRGGGGGGGGGAMPFDPAADPLGMAAYYQAYAASLYGADQPSAKKLRLEDGGSGLGGGDHGLGLGFGAYGDDDRVRKTSMDLPYYSGSLSQAYAAAAAAAAAAAMPHGGHPYLPGGYGASAGGGGGGGGGADKLPVCRDFMNSKCTRPSCRYVHPDATVQVVDNYVTICRDSIRGRCERPHCRFYHPTNKGE